MRSNKITYNVIVEIICLFYVLLFVYAALSKMIDFENFRVQLGQSPLLSAFAGWVAWVVPIIELFIALSLLFKKTRLLGLLAAFTLMVMFTTYIYIILNYSSFVPCSCGGILEKMGWTEHLIFNFVFIIVAVVGILIHYGQYTSRRGFLLVPTTLLIVLTLIGSAAVIVMFLSSESKIHYSNPFVRRFPHHPIELIAEKDLELNSYYIAGIGNSKIYMANYTAPLRLLILDANLQEIQNVELSMTKDSVPYRSVKIIVVPPYVYLTDGTIPYLFRGKINSLQMEYVQAKGYFNSAVPIDSVTFAIRARESKSNENVLGILSLNDNGSIRLAGNLLEKQIDGVFDTDGMLLYNHQLQKIIYTYFYRNEYITTDQNLNSISIGNTIDTITKAQIKVSDISSQKMRKMSAPPLTVNKATATYGNYLFVRSGLIGLYEPENTWKRSSVIDIYDLRDQSYVFSFYIPDRDKDKVSEFVVLEDQLVCLVGNYIRTYKLEKTLFDTFKVP